MFRNKRKQIRSGWLLLTATILLLVTQFLLSLPGISIFKSFTGNTNVETMFVVMKDYPWIELLTNGLPVYGSIFVILVIWKVMNKGTLKEIGISYNSLHAMDFIVGLSFGIIAMTLIFIVLVVSGNVQIERGLSNPTISTYTITYLILFIGVGISEEVFFRGYMMRTLESRGNPKWVIFCVPAFLFALFHGLNPNVTSFGLLNIGLAGLLFGYMFMVTNNLWMPIGYHISWNYFQGNVYGFPVSGTDPYGIFSISVKEGNEWLTGGLFGPEAGVLDTIVTLLFLILTAVYSQNRTKFMKGNH